MVAASFPVDLKEHRLAWPTFSAGQSPKRVKRVKGLSKEDLYTNFTLQLRWFKSLL